MPLATVEAPRLIGEIGALAGMARTASVKAANAAQVLLVDRARLLELGRGSPEFLVTMIRQLGGQIDSVNKALALYANALEALEAQSFDDEILKDLTHASPHLAEFSAAFRRFANHIVKNRRRQEEMASAALIQRSFLPDDSKINFARDEVELRAAMRPARDVGGDFYDFIPLEFEQARPGPRRRLREGYAREPVHERRRDRAPHGRKGRAERGVRDFPGERFALSGQ